MINDNHGLLIELWSRIKQFLDPKERLEAADMFIVVFDEHGLIDDSILDDDLDKELRAAVRSHLVMTEEGYDDYEDDRDEYDY